MLAFLAVLGFVSANTTADGSIIGGFFAVLALGGFVLAWYLYRNFQSAKSRSLVAYQADLRKFEQAIQKWDRLWYCEKCDRVFDPASRQHAASLDAQSLLT